MKMTDEERIVQLEVENEEIRYIVRNLKDILHERASPNSAEWQFCKIEDDSLTPVFK